MGQTQTAEQIFGPRPYGRLVEEIRDFAIIMMDREGAVVSWNRGARLIFGYEESEILGRSFTALFTREDVEGGVPEKELEKAAAEGRAEDVRWHARKDGALFFADGVTTAMLDERGGLRGFAKIARDATAGEEARMLLRESEERYRTLFASIDEGFCVVEMLFDEDGAPADYRFLELNPRFEQLTGIPAGRALGGETARAIIPELESHWYETYGRVALTGEPVRFVNGSEAMRRWFDVYAFPVGEAGSRKVAILFNDITERKLAEEERERLLRSLEVERSRLASVFAKAPAFVATLRGPEHVFELINPAYLQLVGHRDIIGKSAREALPEVHGQGYFELLDGVFRTGEPYEGRELRVMLQREPGAPPVERFVDLLYQPLFEADGSVSGIFAHGVDVTEQVNARKAAEDANRLKDEFLATLSHELRTPLTAILGWARMLSLGQLDEAGARRAVEVIERNAEAQAQLIEEVLDVSRVVSGKMRLEVRPLDLAAVIEAAVDTALPAAEAKGISLRRVLDPGASMVSGDPTRLQQVVWNLLSNAVKFTPKGGSVQVRLERADSHVEIVVVDNGAGISPDILPYVFERFRQADSSSTRTHGGLGLGLAIVRHLVEMHGGAVEAASEGEGRGATFTVKLPLVAVRPSERPAARVTGRLHTPAPEGVSFHCPPELAGLHVMVVDDEEDARSLVAAVLESCDARVTTAGSVEEALSLFGGSRPDVLISDLGMPAEDGYSLIRKVRALSAQEGGRTPAAALTAYASVEDRLKVLRAGFQMHLPKPVEPAELVAVVAALAGARA